MVALISNLLEENGKKTQVIIGGCAENIIKELKIGVGMESLPCGEFEGNTFWLALGVLTYKTFVLQKRHLLSESYWSKTIQTVRWALINIASKVIRHSRSLWLKLQTTLEKFKIYDDMRKGSMAFG